MWSLILSRLLTKLIKIAPDRAEQTPLPNLFMWVSVSCCLSCIHFVFQLVDIFRQG